MTRKEDEWSCEDCGSNLGRHDMWFEGATSGRCGDCEDIKNIPQFPLSVEAKIVSKFMTLDCYYNEDNYFPTERGVKYMSGELKSEVYKCMKIAYNEDETFREWFLKQI